MVSNYSKNESQVKTDNQFYKFEEAKWLHKLLQSQEAYQIFSCPGAKIFKTEKLKLQVAQKLASLGFFDIRALHTVICVDPDDSVIDSYPDAQCREIISVSKGAQPYSDEDFIVCPECGHEFFLSESRKNITSFYQLSTNRNAILELFEYRLFQQNIIYFRLEPGKYCVVSGSVSKIFAITDFFRNQTLAEDWVYFRILMSYQYVETFDLADFICNRRLFSEILNQSKEKHSETNASPQLEIGPDTITLNGKILISAKSKQQWQLFHVFLLNSDTALSISKIGEMLAQQGEFVTDPEQQIRRPINKIRKKVEQLGYSANTLIVSSDGGYCFNSKAFRTLYVS